MQLRWCAYYYLKPHATMEQQTLELIKDLLPSSYISQASAALSQRRSLIKSLLSQRCMPEVGWDETSIEQLLHVNPSIQSTKHLIS